MATIADLTFDNSYARLPATFHHFVEPTPVPNPYLVAFNPDAAALIDLDATATPELVESFAGNRLLAGSQPLAMKYAGHQFGSYVPQLGDGRAILLGEVRNRAGEKWDLHLKGAGPTAFSRFGDGRAVLRSSIREYLASEAMFALGIPTTRALCIVGSNLPVSRECPETAALVLRMAPSHVRFGSFEVFAHRGQTADVKSLTDYVIEQHFPHLQDRDDRYAAFLTEVVRRTARLVAEWQAVGFEHGVLNTDNMSILGITLDYGPYGFMEEFDRGWICNHSDESGRYAFDQQPSVGYWNLAALAQALLSLIPLEDAKAALNTYPDVFNTHVHELMRAKLGLATDREGDTQLWSGFLDVLAGSRADYTNAFRALASFDSSDELRSLFADASAFDEWAKQYRERLRQEESNADERRERMNRVNPKYVLRNYLAQAAIDRAQERDYTEIARLHELLKRPFDEQPEMQAYSQPGPEWTKHLVVSCSS